MRQRVVSLNRKTSTDWILALTSTLLAGALYLRTLQPTLGGMFNSEEYQYAAYSLSLVHPTGYPLFLLLGKLWVTLVPFGNVAFRMNLFSAWWGALATLLAFFIILQLTRNRAASVFGALLFATNEAVWRQASVAEVDTFTAFLASAVILSLLLWRTGRVRLEICALIYGLALVHHRTSIFYAPGILFFIINTRREIWRAPSQWLRALGVMLLPLLFYLYVPLRAVTAPDIVHDAQSLLMYIAGINAGSNNVVASNSWLAQTDLIYHTYFWNWFSALGIGLAILGLVSRPRLLEADNAATKILLALTFLLVTLFTIPYELADIDRYLLVPVMIFSILAGVGATRLAQLFARHIQNPRAAAISQFILFSALFTLPLHAALINFPNVDFSQNYRTYGLWNEIFSLPIEPGAVIIGNWAETNAIRYMQRVEGRRTDLQVDSIYATDEIVTQQVTEHLARGQIVYLTPSDPAPQEDWHYRALGPLLRVSREPNRIPLHPPVTYQQDFGALALAGYGVSVSLTEGTSHDAVNIAPSQSARLALYWQIKSTPTTDYNVRVQLRDSVGHLLWQTTGPPLRGRYPTTRWSAGEWVSESQGIFVPYGTPPGICQVQIALIDPQTENTIESNASWSILNVTRANKPAADNIFVRQRQPVDWGNLQLLGYTGGGTNVRAGTPLEFALVWHARDILREDYSLRVRVEDADKKVYAESVMPIVRALATSQWNKGEAFKEYYTLLLPAKITPGNVSLYFTVLDGQGNSIAPEINLFGVTVSP